MGLGRPSLAGLTLGPCRASKALLVIQESWVLVQALRCEGLIPPCPAPPFEFWVGWLLWTSGWSGACAPVPQGGLETSQVEGEWGAGVERNSSGGGASPSPALPHLGL